MAQQATPRNCAQVSEFFEGIDLVEPGLIRVPEWRPAMAIDAKAPAQMWAGVALKPERPGPGCGGTARVRPVAARR
jgi:hypothetical protein